MKKNIIILSLLLSILSLKSYSQSTTESTGSTKGPNAFPELINTNIPGAPTLGKPQLIIGTTLPLIGGGMGWAAPAVYDWDGDGNQDLLIGEFGSGYEHGNAVGNFIRVYKNTGSNTVPEFSNRFNYARHARYPYEKSPNGTPISVYTWCCLAFTPQFIDLDNDGFKDLITGQYNPGEVTWFRGTENGFLPGVKLEQAGNPSAKKDSSLPDSDPKSWMYWNYSSASFGDFDGDGDDDLITGGSTLRISENIGSKTKPRFGLRKPLLDTNDNPLRVYQPTEEELKKYPSMGSSATGTSAMPLVVDWDKDGVLDLLVTGIYHKKGESAVTFFRGVKTHKGHRFKPGKPLFSAKDGGKSFPGSWLVAYVTDWNSDGVNDLLIGTSVATINGGEFSHKLSWSWEADTKILKKNYGLNYDYDTLAYAEKMMEQAKKDPKYAKRRVENVRERYGYLLDGGDPSLIHQGYVYVMLGKKREK
ncbi:VCBS repeat-containing protein [uncultured Polaribacter sp.]|uniref:FG-GAP repeat domain-containing protein n=1 Tax=uncultured Polaribacter sp. TaxID=174711 RepID=UPI002611D9F6|nr:VCBS repeat-containing protein [uncultured Polaribacter sp.]